MESCRIEKNESCGIEIELADVNPDLKKLQELMEEKCVCCLEELELIEPLICGHRVHDECLRKHFRPECPICRMKLNIVVSGTIPEDDESLFTPYGHNNTLNTHVNRNVSYGYNLYGDEAAISDAVLQESEILEQERMLAEYAKLTKA